MASSSSSSAPVTTPRIKNYYDVFVSFRGTDTRLNFTDHLFGALQRKHISAFRDDTKLQKGESIGPELFHAIESSQVFIVVFSKNYASSTWCLRELEYILYCSQLNGKHVLPIFYDVDPSEVRHQKGSYGEALAKHEERSEHDSELVQRWRAALTQVADLSGWDMRNKPQNAEIEKIIEKVINILGYKFESLPKDLVGMDSPIEELEKLLLLDSTDIIRVVGICGMGGIGKTTLANALYRRISHQFDAHCFIDDISKVYRHDGLIGAQKQILQALGEEHLQICNLYNATNLIQRRLGRIRSLLVLDNVDQVEQLEKLPVNSECLGAGSRIIVTSRNAHILKEYEVDEVYNAQLLNATDSLQLFCQKAFKLDHIVSGYDKLAFDILSYVNGLPLGIKVLGSFLFGKNIVEWESALVRLRVSPDKDIMKVLRLSFDGLEKLEQEIFLDIACFFYSFNKKYVTNVLNCCGFHADIGLRDLSDKSLISINDGDIQMHCLLKELGRKIVQENSTKDLKKWSRLWLPEHFDNVMLENMEKNVEAIVLSRQYPREIKTVAAETLSNMSHLRLLILADDVSVHFSGSLSHLSNELRYVAWTGYPFMYLPISFQPYQLIELHLFDSSIKQLWEAKKYLPNLKTMDLKYSKNLIKLPDFGEVPNLETLNLKGCVNLVRMNPSIGLVRKLDSNESVLHSQSMSSVLKWITLPFHSLYPKAHKGLAICLWSSLPSFSFLWELDISFCGLSQIPDAIGCIRSLGRLNLRGNNFVTLPSLKELSKLVHLDLQHCKKLKFLPELPLPEHAIKQEWKCGLHIYNCPELGEREHTSSLNFSWMIQFIQANQESSASFPKVDIVIPGSEIPRWFNNQSIGNSMSIDLSPIVHNKYFIGIACCVVFPAIYDDPTMTTYRETPLARLCFKCGNTEGIFAYCPAYFYSDLVTVKSNHMWIIYIPWESLFDFLSKTNTTFRDLDHITMITDLKSDEYLHVEVKKCGYRCVLKQDLQQFNSTVMN